MEIKVINHKKNLVYQPGEREFVISILPLEKASECAERNLNAKIRQSQKEFEYIKREDLSSGKVFSMKFAKACTEANAQMAAIFEDAQIKRLDAYKILKEKYGNFGSFEKENNLFVFIVDLWNPETGSCEKFRIKYT